MLSRRDFVAGVASMLALATIPTPVMRAVEAADAAPTYIWNFSGTPLTYEWGADPTVGSIDCSGLVSFAIGRAGRIEVSGCKWFEQEC